MRQITPAKSNIVEKILRDGSGRLVRATFCVYECGGRMKARLVSAVYLDENISIRSSAKTPLKNYTTLLTSPRTVLGGYKEIVFESKTVSPYFNKNTLYSFGSKPRAPTVGK